MQTSTAVTIPGRARQSLPALSSSLREQIEETTKQRRKKSRAANTIAAYASDWKQFNAWCLFTGEQALPAAPDVVAHYIAHMSASSGKRNERYSTATIRRRLAAIAFFHRKARVEDPTASETGKERVEDPTASETVKETMEGISRENAGKPTRAKDALLVKHLKRGLRGEPKKLIEHRNRAMLLVGFTGAFRCSELVAIDVEHLTFNEAGAMQIRIPKSKTNQHGELESVWIHPAGDCCPVRALREWLRVSRLTSGAVFRSIDRHQNVKRRISKNLVAYTVKQFAKKVGLDPKQFAAHSLRSGFVTQALSLELPIDRVQAQTRHRDINTLIRYRRNIDAEKNGITGRLGL